MLQPRHYIAQGSFSNYILWKALEYAIFQRISLSLIDNGISGGDIVTKLGSLIGMAW